MSRKRDNRAAELAWHFLEGDDSERALHWVLAAGDGAELVFAHSDAETHYRTALELARERDDGDREVEAREKLGGALHMLARYQEELDILLPTLQMYRDRGDLEGEMRTAAAIGWAYFEVARRSDGIATLTPMLVHWEAEGPHASAAAAELHIALGNLHWAEGNGDEALRLFERGTELATKVGDRRLLGRAESRRGLQLMTMGRIDEALETFNRSTEIAEAAGDLETLARTLNNRALLHGMGRKDWVRANMDIRRQIDVSRKASAPAQVAWALFALSSRLWVKGNWVEAGELLDEAARIARQLGISRSSRAIPAAANLHLLTGDITALVELEECVAAGKREHDTVLLVEAQLCLAAWDLIQNRPGDAVARMEECLGDPTLEDQSHVWVQALLAEGLAHTDDVDRADQLVTDLLAKARQANFAPLIVRSCNVQGIVRTEQQHWTEARTAFEEALTLVIELGGTFIQSQILHDYGRLEARMGNRDAARSRFQEELSLLHLCGAVPLIERAERELALLNNPG